MILINNRPVTFYKIIQSMEAQANHGTTSTTYARDGEAQEAFKKTSHKCWQRH